MLRVYGHHIFFNSFSAGTVLRRQILTSKHGICTERVNTNGVILGNSIALTSDILTELVNTIKYGEGCVIQLCFHRVVIQNGFR